MSSHIRKCTKCGLKAFDSKDLHAFKKDKTCKFGYANECKACQIRIYHERKNLPEVKLSFKRSDVKKKYGITLEEYNAAMDTSDYCEICGSIGNLQFDHNHDTGEFRGVLCNKCNTGLGLFMDTPALLKNALNYLQKRGSYGKDI